MGLVVMLILGVLSGQRAVPDSDLPPSIGFDSFFTGVADVERRYGPSAFSSGSSGLPMVLPPGDSGGLAPINRYRQDPSNAFIYIDEARTRAAGSGSVRKPNRVPAAAPVAGAPSAPTAGWSGGTSPVWRFGQDDLVRLGVLGATAVLGLCVLLWFGAEALRLLRWRHAIMQGSTCRTCGYPLNEQLYVPTCAECGGRQRLLRPHTLGGWVGVYLKQRRFH